MIFDSTNLFSDAQAITTSAASTNIIDTGARDTPKHAANAITRDIGKGTPIAVRIQVVEDFATLTSLQVSIQTAGADTFAATLSDLAGGDVAVADLVAGYVFPLQWLPRDVLGRYVRLYYTVTGSAATAGKITAGLVFANEERDV